ncbi:MAG: pentapeptide repeat-containing protein [Acetobacteraceae bacterium]|nr:pentapeptide repeat-containing protein [Acetobacteraceae bacterium]
MRETDHVSLLREGKAAWSAWREANPSIRPDLRDPNLSGANMRGALLREVDLGNANLSRARSSAAATSAGPISVVRTCVLAQSIARRS